MKIKSIFSLFKQAFAEWRRDRVSLLAAALAYYTVLSIAPLIVIAIAIAGSVFGADAAQGEIVEALDDLVGQQGATVIEAIIANANQPQFNSVASAVSAVVLLVSASGLFYQLQMALNIVWNVKTKPNAGVRGFIHKRLLSFGMVLVIGLLLLASLIISTVLSTISQLDVNFISSTSSIWQNIDLIASLGIVILLFALIYKYLPDVELSWKNVWIGAVVTALLFILGKYLVGFYISRSNLGSTYGAAGSLVVVLTWVFYSTQILLFGAELTQVYTRRYGAPIRPNRHAVIVNAYDRSE